MLCNLKLGNHLILKETKVIINSLASSFPFSVLYYVVLLERTHVDSSSQPKITFPFISFKSNFVIDFSKFCLFVVMRTGHSASHENVWLVVLFVSTERILLVSVLCFVKFLFSSPLTYLHCITFENLVVRAKVKVMTRDRHTKNRIMCVQICLFLTRKTTENENFPEPKQSQSKAIEEEKIDDFMRTLIVTCLIGDRVFSNHLHLHRITSHVSSIHVMQYSNP